MGRESAPFLATLFTVTLLLAGVSAAGHVTESDLRRAMEDEAMLMSGISEANAALEEVPGSIKGVIGTDELYHVRIDGTNIALTLRDGRIASVSSMRPSSPTKRLDTNYDVLVRIANADEPVQQAIIEFINNRIRISSVGGCSSDRACADNEICESGRCAAAFTVAVVPLGYTPSETNDFLQKASWEVEYMKSKLPTDKIRVHYVSPSVCNDVQCRDACEDCQTAAYDCVRRAGLASAVDKIAAVSDNPTYAYPGGRQFEICGCAGGIPSLTSVSKSHVWEGNMVWCLTTMVHEVGHSLGLYHVDATGQEAGACLGPNAADCQQTDKQTDIMGYGAPRDHFGPAALNHLKNRMGDYTR